MPQFAEKRASFLPRSCSYARMGTVPKLVLLITLVACALSVLHAELKEVVFAPQWIPQNQFAGFYVAKEKGFYEDEWAE